MPASISVFGLGYVGTVTAACLARQGNKVVGVDVNAAKISAFEAGSSPVVEPEVGDLIAEGRAQGRLSATSDSERAVQDSEISFLCVGTPSLKNGKLDLGHIGPVCAEIGSALRTKSGFHMIVLRSTVLPGTAETLVIPALEQSCGRRFGDGFGVCVNPEFMREGTAVKDFLEPAITIIGGGDARHRSILREVYRWAPGKVFETSFRSAEMVKYVCNAWHAVKVSFANEVGVLAHALDADTEEVMDIFLADTRLNISPAYLKPGFAFGGSCLPKDVRALNYRAKELDMDLPLFESILSSNHEHLERAVETVLETGKSKIAVLGLSFKAATDDLRESPHVQLVKRLLGEGRSVKIWDDSVSLGRLIGSNREYIEQVIPHIGSLLVPDMKRTVEDAELVIIATRAISREQLQSVLRANQTVVDLVNLETARRPSVFNYLGMCW